jgi:phosphoglycerate dehydrogenase-like enzyme
MTRIAILDDYQGVAESLADWSGLELTSFRDHLADEHAVADRLAGFDVVVAMRERTPFPRTLLERLPKLRLLVTTGMRNASIDVAAARDLGIVVSGTSGSAASTPELAWGLVLAVARGIPQEHESVRSGAWQVGLGTELEGKTLGVLGLGRIGSRVARYGLAFGMEVIAWSQNLTRERAESVGARLVERDELFAHADVLTVHLVLSERTRGLVGGRELALMKDGAFLVNTSRGPIVDERALVDVLERRAIAGAALDVFDEEPLQAEHPFRRLDNVVVTPHVGYVTLESYRVFYREAAEDVHAFLAGTPIRVVEP